MLMEIGFLVVGTIMLILLAFAFVDRRGKKKDLDKMEKEVKKEQAEADEAMEKIERLLNLNKDDEALSLINQRIATLESDPEKLFDFEDEASEFRDYVISYHLDSYKMQMKNIKLNSKEEDIDKINNSFVIISELAGIYVSEEYIEFKKLQIMLNSMKISEDNVLFLNIRKKAENVYEIKLEKEYSESAEISQECSVNDFERVKKMITKRKLENDVYKLSKPNIEQILLKVKN
tara:strand:- start:43743 stop:44441 length:699 start_codon:yes stop_codon:yes gene_type:complete